MLGLSNWGQIKILEAASHHSHYVANLSSFHPTSKHWLSFYLEPQYSQPKWAKSVVLSRTFGERRLSNQKNSWKSEFLTTNPNSCLLHMYISVPVKKSACWQVNKIWISFINNSKYFFSSMPHFFTLMVEMWDAS